MKQVYHPYLLWEDFKNGMWRKESKSYEEKTLPEIISFTGDRLKYGAAMLLVIEKWQISCEHNLTNKGINRKAWIGHAACCIEKGYPEYLVRIAWGMLTEEQRVLANKAADYAIQKWETNYLFKKANTTQLSLWSKELNPT